MTELEQRAAVEAEAMTWLGTPYHWHARLRGAGVDCAQILAAVFEAAGVVESAAVPAYARDWHLHRSEELYEQTLEANGARRLPDGERPQAGDIALYRFGRTFSHAGIVVSDGRLVHALLDAGMVTLSGLDDAPLGGRPVHFWSYWR